jgi:integrase
VALSFRHLRCRTGSEPRPRQRAPDGPRRLPRRESCRSPSEGVGGSQDARTDPINHRDAAKAAKAAATVKVASFDECADAFVADHEKGWSASHRHDWARCIANHVRPVFGKTPVNLVDTAHVLKVLRPIWRSKNPTAKRVREAIEATLDWATANHFRDGLNPARWKGHIANILGDANHIVKHHPAMPYKDVGGLIAKLGERDDRDARCLELLILTATRVDAAAGARAEEFDLVNRVWTVPPERMKRKGKRRNLPFRIPMSDAVVALIERNGVKEGRLFPGADHISLRDVRRMMTGRGDWTSHGFRSTFRDWCGERTSVPRDVVEMAMQHVVADDTEAALVRPLKFCYLSLPRKSSDANVRAARVGGGLPNGLF